jgi:7-cyano-7-deazaguanine synthase
VYLLKASIGRHSPPTLLFSMHLATLRRMKTEEKTKPIAIVLFSGGLDSTTCLAIAQKQGFKPIALSIHYGQKQQAELLASQSISAALSITHHIINLPVPGAQASSLTNPNLTTPDYQPSKTIPITYVPARNLIFLSLATSFAEAQKAQAIFIGVNAIDYSNYPDCRPEFISAFNQAANLGTRLGQTHPLTIHTPLINKTKAQIIQWGTSLGLDYSQTVSCYRADAKGRGCGSCDACHFRKQGFLQAGLADPTHYQTQTA